MMNFMQADPDPCLGSDFEQIGPCYSWGQYGHSVVKPARLIQGIVPELPVIP